MSFRTTAVRAAAVVGAAGMLIASGQAIASATTVDRSIEGSKVTVTFTAESGQVADSCGAALTPTSYTPRLAGVATNVNLDGILSLLDDNEVTILKSDAIIPSPVVFPSFLSPASVQATDVEPNVYALVTFCTSSPRPNFSTVTVGNPLQAIQGSIGTLSADPTATSTAITGLLNGGSGDNGGSSPTGS